MLIFVIVVVCLLLFGIPRRSGLIGSGLYKKGKKSDSSELKPIEQIPWLAEVVKIAGTNVESAPIGAASSSSSTDAAKKK